MIDNLPLLANLISLSFVLFNYNKYDLLKFVKDEKMTLFKRYDL